VVPANLPALGFTPGVDRSNTSLRATSADFQLSASDGTLVPTSGMVDPAGDGTRYLITPASALQTGKTYQVRYPLICNLGPLPGSDGGISTAEQSFNTGPTMALPTVTGTASQTSHRLSTISVWTISGTCTSPIVAAIAHIKVDPSPELRAYLAVAQVDAFVGGQPAPVINYKEPSAATDPVELDIYAGCVVPDSGAEPGLAAGKYTVELRSHVLGAAADPPPITTNIELVCGNCPTADESKETGRTTSLVWPGCDQSTAGGVPAKSGGGGCSLSGFQKSTGLSILALLLLAVLKRRSQP
jgi:hypothetical protein